MSKFLMALISGMFVYLVIDFFLFLALFLNFIQKNDIAIYYNVLFADNQSFILFVLASAVFGVILIYISNKKLNIVLITLSTILIVTFFTNTRFYADIVLIEKEMTLYEGKYKYNGDIYYKGRVYSYIWNKELDKLIKIKNTDVYHKTFFENNRLFILFLIVISIFGILFRFIPKKKRTLHYK